jgi:DNA-binding response OmpR family regulator
MATALISRAASHLSDRRSSGSTRRAPRARPEIRKVTSRRIALVVNDDPLLQRAMAKRLKKAQFQVLTALHFNEAVDHLSAIKLDIACIDLGLPSESGYELCEQIRNRPHLAWLPILATSERCFPEEMAHAEEAGASAVLKKPFPMDRLVQYVSALLDGPARG